MPEQEPIRRFTVMSVDEKHVPVDSERVRSEYVEEHWLPFIGPTALLLARRIDQALATSRREAMDTQVLSPILGVEGPAAVVNALNRLVRYGLATWDDKNRIFYLQRHWPKVPAAITTSTHRQALLEISD